MDIIKNFFRIWFNKRYMKRYVMAISGGVLSLIFLPVLLLGIIGLCVYYVIGYIFEKLEDNR